MKDYNTEQRQQWLAEAQSRAPDESGWWWAIACVALAILVMLAGHAGPVLFPAG